METNLNPRPPRSKLRLIEALGPSTESSVPSAANDGPSASNGTLGGTVPNGRLDGRPDPFRQCKDDERTQHLTSLLGRWYYEGKTQDEATLLALAWNMRNLPPLPDDKVLRTAASMFQTHQRNHPAPSDETKLVTQLFDLEEARIDRFLNKDPPARKWLLNDCLPLGKVGLLVAPGGTGKSQFALQLAVAVATGGSLAEWWRVGEKGRVLALFAEEDEEELHRRVSAILRGLRPISETYEFQADLRKNLFIRSMTAADNLMTKADGVGGVTRTNYAERLCATVKELSDLNLIITDPVSRFRGGNENYAEDATRFVEAAELIAKETGATVLLVHHANKASTKEGEQNQTAARGSSALTDGVRFQMNLAPPTEKQLQDLGLDENVKSEYLAVKVTKSNYAPSGGVVFLHRGEHGVLTYHEPQQAQRNAFGDRIDLVRRLLQDDAEKGRRHSKNSFAKRYCGVDGPFKMGQNKLEQLIGGAIEEGFLQQERGNAKILSTTDRPARIAKAKIELPGSMEAA